MYPPRTPTRYAGAASTPKDVVIVIDVSGSMSHEVSPGRTRLDDAKEAAKWVVNTLSWVDYATVIFFASSAGTVGPSTSALMMRMNVENRALLKRSVQLFNYQDPSLVASSSPPRLNVSTSTHDMRRAHAA